jgi:hypothetical protein
VNCHQRMHQAHSMCRFPAICGRHMECACYWAGEVSAIGRWPPRKWIAP